jgi:hypothetical protein
MRCSRPAWSRVGSIRITPRAAGGIGLRVLTGEGAAIDTTKAAGKLVFGIFATLAEFERELLR